MSWLSSQACMNAGNGHTTRGLRRRGCIHVSRGCSDDMSSESDTEWGAKETIFWLLLCCLCLRPWFRKNEKKNTNQVIIEFHLFMTVKCQLLTAYSIPIKPEGRKWSPLNIQRNLMIPYCLYLSYDIQQL